MDICRLCHSKKINKCFDFGQQAVVNSVLRAPNESHETNSFQLFECNQCGLLQMQDYFLEQNKIYENYITLSSFKSQPHAETIITRIKEFKGSLENLNLLEIGCNDGSFIKRAKSKGLKSYLGIEPTKDTYSICKNENLNVHNDFFSKKLVEEQGMYEQYDVIIFRQVLEHIVDLHDFMAGVKTSLKNDGVVVIEVPDHTMNYECLDYTFWEEHVNYFTLSTLKQLLQAHSLTIIHYDISLFSGRCIVIYATITEEAKDRTYKDEDQLSRKNYIRKHPNLIKSFKEYIDSFSGPIAVYGYGCRSANFINLNNLWQHIDFFIDDNPIKYDNYAPISKLPIYNFEIAEKYLGKNSLVLLGVNTEAELKILRKLNPNIKSCSILPPSPRLPKFWQELAIN